MSHALDEKARQGVAEVFQPVLHKLLDLNLTLKHVHWNIRGPGFRPLHLHLDEIVEMTREFSDEIAERMVALDQPADGRTGAVASQSGLDPLHEGFIEIRPAIAALVGHFDRTIAAARSAQDTLADIDPVSEDLAIEVLRTLEKQRWMLAAEIDNRD